MSNLPLSVTKSAATIHARITATVEKVGETLPAESLQLRSDVATLYSMLTEAYTALGLSVKPDGYRKSLQAAAIEALNYPPKTKTEWSKLNLLVKVLTQHEATPEDIYLRVRRYKVKYPTIPFPPSPQALQNNWIALATPVDGEVSPIRELTQADLDVIKG